MASSVMHVLRSRHSATRTANGKAHRLAVKNVRLLPNRAQKESPICEYLVNLPHPAERTPVQINGTHTAR